MKWPLGFLKHDVIEAMTARLEAYGDELERVAMTAEARALARGFESLRAEIMDAMVFLAAPERVAEKRGIDIEMDR